jgi:hypothetical protein
MRDNLRRPRAWAAALVLLIAAPSVRGQTPDRLLLLDGRASVVLPAGERAMIDGDSVVVGVEITSGTHRFIFRTFEVVGAQSAEVLLEKTAAKRMQTAPAEVTVNLDRISCGAYGGVDLSHWMWHPNAKPQGLLLSKDRIFIMENLLVFMTVEGIEAGIIEPVADEFFDGVHLGDSALCIN